MGCKLASRQASRFDALFRFKRFPTRSTLYVEIVIRGRGQVIMERRTLCRSPTQNLWLISARQIWHVSCQILYNRTSPCSSRCCYIHIDMSSQPKDQANRRRRQIQRSSSYSFSSDSDHSSQGSYDFHSKEPSYASDSSHAHYSDSDTSQPRDQANQHPPVQRSNTDGSEIQSTAEHSIPEQVGEPPVLIAYVIHLLYSV